MDINLRSGGRMNRTRMSTYGLSSNHVAMLLAGDTVHYIKSYSVVPRRRAYTIKKVLVANGVYVAR